MKKYLPIFLAFQILVTSSPNNQGAHTILKMGAFFHHFLCHITCHKEDIGIVNFIKLHYSSHEHQKSDHAEHQKLPFQHHPDQQNIAPQLPCLLPLQLDYVAFYTVEIVPTSLIFHAQQWCSSSYLGDIWQPPKV